MGGSLAILNSSNPKQVNTNLLTTKNSSTLKGDSLKTNTIGLNSNSSEDDPTVSISTISYQIDRTVSFSYYIQLLSPNITINSASCIIGAYMAKPIAIITIPTKVGFTYFTTRRLNFPSYKENHDIYLRVEVKFTRNDNTTGLASDSKDFFVGAPYISRCQPLSVNGYNISLQLFLHSPSTDSKLYYGINTTSNIKEDTNDQFYFAGVRSSNINVSVPKDTPPSSTYKLHLLLIVPY